MQKTKYCELLEVKKNLEYLFNEWQTKVEKVQLDEIRRNEEQKKQDYQQGIAPFTKWQDNVSASTEMPVGLYLGHNNSTPLIAPFIAKGNIFIINRGNNGKTARKILQSLTRQAMAIAPAFSTKFTLIDPRELGGTFPFSDVPLEIRGQAVYVRQDEITPRIATLVEHVRDTLQQTDKYEDIQDYNSNAGLDKYIPYQIVSIADFPHRFDEDSMENILSITRRSVETGVYFITHIDSEMTLPDSFNPSELLETGTVIYVTDDGISLKLGNEQFPVQLDEEENTDDLLQHLSDAEQLSTIPSMDNLEIIDTYLNNAKTMQSQLHETAVEIDLKNQRKAFEHQIKEFEQGLQDIIGVSEDCDEIQETVNDITLDTISEKFEQSYTDGFALLKEVKSNTQNKLIEDHKFKQEHRKRIILSILPFLIFIAGFFIPFTKTYEAQEGRRDNTETISRTVLTEHYTGRTPYFILSIIVTAFGVMTVRHLQRMESGWIRYILRIGYIFIGIILGYNSIIVSTNFEIGTIKTYGISYYLALRLMNISALAVVIIGLTYLPKSLKQSNN